MVCLGYLTFLYVNVDADYMNPLPAGALNVHRPMALITPNMMNIELIQDSHKYTKAKLPNTHPLAASLNLAQHFSAKNHAYS